VTSEFPPIRMQKTTSLNLIAGLSPAQRAMRCGSSYMSSERAIDSDCAVEQTMQATSGHRTDAAVTLV